MSGSDFWSRRKTAVAAEDEAEGKAEPTAEDLARKQTLEAKSDEEILRELDLPDPDDLQSGDDFAAFLKAAVPERLLRRALRRLWTTDPVLANLDGLVEYGEDFTDSATVIENLSTAYRVGKGMNKHVEEMLRQTAEEDGRKEQIIEEVAENPTELPLRDEVEPMDESNEPTAADRNEVLPGDPESDESAEVVSERFFCARPGRMRYRFE